MPHFCTQSLALGNCHKLFAGNVHNKYCFLIITWPSHDYHMTITWPSHDSHDRHVTITWPSCDYHMLIVWLSHDRHVTGFLHDPIHVCPHWLQALCSVWWCLLPQKTHTVSCGFQNNKQSHWNCLFYWTENIMLVSEASFLGSTCLQLIIVGRHVLVLRNDSLSSLCVL